MVLAIPVVVVFEKPVSAEWLQRFVQTMGNAQPLYNLVATGVKNNFGPYRGAVKVIVGYGCGPGELHSAYAALGTTYQALNRPLGLETDDSERIAISAAEWIAHNCDIQLVMELLRDHVNKQTRGR